MVEERLEILKKYIDFRLNNKVNDLLNLFSDKCVLITYDGNTYNNKEELEDYFNNPIQSIPKIKNIKQEFGNIYSLELHFIAGIKIIKVTFTFENVRSNLIYSIKMSSIGWI